MKKDALQMEKGMAIVLLTVVMPLSFLFSCFREKKELIDVVFDPQTSYTLKETNVNSLVSDSGITRYRMVTPTWLVFGKATEPYWFFPNGIYIEKFDTLLNIEASIQADTAYYYQRRKLWEAKRNVDITNLEGRRVQTEQLFWNQQEEHFPFYSDLFIRITDGENISTGIGFRANPDMSYIEISKASAEYAIEMQQRATVPDSIVPVDSLILPPDTVPPGASVPTDTVTVLPDL